MLFVVDTESPSLLPSATATIFFSSIIFASKADRSFVAPLIVFIESSDAKKLRLFVPTAVVAVVSVVSSLAQSLSWEEDEASSAVAEVDVERDNEPTPKSEAKTFVSSVWCNTTPRWTRGRVGRDAGAETAAATASSL